MLIIKVFKNKTSIPKTYRVEEFPCKIGRSKINDVVIESDSVSVEHCEIQEDDNGYFVTDLDSTNKIIFNDQEVDNHQINEGDKISIGEIEIVFHIENEEHDRTKVIHYPTLMKKRRLQQLIGNKEMMRTHLYALLICLLLLVFEWIFEYNFEMKIFFRSLFVLIFSFSSAYVVFALLSRVINHKYQWRKIYQVGVFTVSICLLLGIVSELISGLFINDSYVRQVSSLICKWFIFFQLASVLCVQFKKKSVAIVTVSIMVVMTAGSIIVENSFDNLSRYEMGGPIIYPLINYSKETYTHKNLWNGIEEHLEKIDEEREELIKEKKKYFD